MLLESPTATNHTHRHGHEDPQAPGSFTDPQMLSYSFRAPLMPEWLHSIPEKPPTNADSQYNLRGTLRLRESSHNMEMPPKSQVHNEIPLHLLTVLQPEVLPESKIHPQPLVTPQSPPSASETCLITQTPLGNPSVFTSPRHSLESLRHLLELGPSQLMR